MIVACTPKPKVQHWPGEPDVVYIGTEEGNLLGLYTDGAIRVYPQFDRIKSVIADEAFIFYSKSKKYLFGYHGKALCDSVPLLVDVLPFEQFKGFGVPGSLVKIPTEKGIYAIFAEGRLDWTQYGPFNSFHPASGGYIYGDVKTKKLGVGKYGKWEDRDPEDKRRMVNNDKYYFLPCEKLENVLEPKYEKIINVVDVDNSWQFKKFGYTKPSDVRWYAYNGESWLQFDFYGKPMKLNDAERQWAEGMGIRSSVVYGLHDYLLTQRVGTAKASVVYKVKH